MIQVSKPDPNSLLVWWPSVRFALVPKPRTIIVPAERRYVSTLLDPHTDRDVETKAYLESFWTRFYAGAKEIGYPLFMRTDLVSGKHQWRRTCYVPDQMNAANHLHALVEANEMAGMFGVDYGAVVFREYIPLAARFTAFDGMPVASERRYFIQDRKIVCHHPYWIEDAIHSYDPLPEDWKVQLAEINEEGEDEVSLLSGYADELAHLLDGAWSLDFARTKEGGWIFIDAANADSSWHPPCPMQGISGPGAGGESEMEIGLTEEEAATMIDILKPINIPEPPRFA